MHHNSQKTHCPQGHSYSASNTYVDSKGIRHCKACQRQRQPKHDITRNSKRRAFIAEIKDVPCVDCGHRFHHCAMDFDHVRGVKSFNIAQQLNHRTLDEIIEEIVSKCEVVCANCHRVREWKKKHG